VDLIVGELEKRGDAERLVLGPRRAGQLPRECPISGVNGSDWTGEIRDGVEAGHDVLEAGPPIAIGAGRGAPRKQRLRKVDGMVVVLAKNLKLQVVPERRGRGDPPAHDRYVLLGAVNQFDFLGGIGRGNEQHVAATDRKHGHDQKHRRGQCAAAGGPMRLARPVIQLA
jgi:hypothetical protein